MMTKETKALLAELEAFVWYRTDELDEEMIEKLVQHIEKQDKIVEEVNSFLQELNETLSK